MEISLIDLMGNNNNISNKNYHFILFIYLIVACLIMAVVHGREFECQEDR
jgi:ABC-type arginine/histidine transport system permease subunit